MSKVATKRKRPLKWVVTLQRPVGEFKNGERRMMTYWDSDGKEYKNEKQARRALFANWRYPIVAFRYRKGNKPRKIVEIQVFDDSYSRE